MNTIIGKNRYAAAMTEKAIGEDRYATIAMTKTAVKRSLFEKIEPYLAPYKISSEKLMTAIEEAFQDTGEISENISREILPLVFWKMFGCENILWIVPETPAGNIVPFDILATAYAMWCDAQKVAYKRGLDGVDAAEALTTVVNTIVDRICDGNAPEIHDMRKYIFVCYAHALSRVAAKAGGIRPHSRGKKNDLSDDGAFVTSLENAILCRELLSVMPPKMQKAAILRYAIGYSCEETAEEIGTSNRATRKALSSGIRKAFGFCMRELRGLGNKNIEQITKSALGAKAGRR